MRAAAVLALALVPAVLHAEKGADARKWAEHTGKIEFVIGYEEGLEEAKASGKPMMVYITTTW